jgi:hypothetical protein
MRADVKRFAFDIAEKCAVIAGRMHCRAPDRKGRERQRDDERESLHTAKARKKESGMTWIMHPSRRAAKQQIGELTRGPGRLMTRETPFAANAAKRLECLQERQKGIENG